MIFSDATLRDIARRRPATLDGFREVRGVGEKKCNDYGRDFVDRVVSYSQEHDLATDVNVDLSQSAPLAAPAEITLPNATAVAAFDLFRGGQTVEQVASALNRARSTVLGYLGDYLRTEAICDPSPWVDDATIQRVSAAVAQVGTERLKPIFEQLNGEVPYDQIRIVIECLRNAASQELPVETVT